MVQGRIRRLTLGGGLLLAGLGLTGCGSGSTPPPTATAGKVPTTPEGAVEALKRGDDATLEAWHAQLTANSEPEAAIAADAAGDGIARLGALRGGYPKLAGPARVLAVEATTALLGRFAVEGTPAGWNQVLKPAFDLLSAGLSDPDVTVRAASLDAVGRLWGWSPGCTMTPGEEQTLADWKEGLYPTVVRRLADPEPVSRIKAIGCLGKLPLDDRAAPAIAYLRDPDFSVRLQVLVAFANRPQVLGEEAILPILHDPVPDLGQLAERVLKARGLDSELIGLGKLVTHPRAEMRASAIPLLVRRDDIDPVIWLLHLSEDADATVRLRAVEAFPGRITPEVRDRLRAMASQDASEAVRAAAAKLVPASTEPTATLPPLPPAVRPRLVAN